MQQMCEGASPRTTIRIAGRHDFRSTDEGICVFKSVRTDDSIAAARQRDAQRGGPAPSGQFYLVWNF